MSTRTAGIARTKKQEFRALMTSIVQKLQNSASNALEDLKFQSQDYIELGKREKIKSLYELFTVWEEIDIVHADEITFLARCLENIHRKDLVKLVKRYEEKKPDLLDPDTKKSENTSDKA